MAVPLLPSRATYITGTGHTRNQGMDPDSLPPAAQRALAEAEARRKASENQPPLPPELGGRNGPEPVRFGDWEKKGLAVDF
jgi:hypothetical protein